MLVHKSITEGCAVLTFRKQSYSIIYGDLTKFGMYSVDFATAQDRASEKKSRRDGCMGLRLAVRKVPNSHLPMACKLSWLTVINGRWSQCEAVSTVKVHRARKINQPDLIRHALRGWDE